MNLPRVWPWADLVDGGGLGLCRTPWSGPLKGQRAVLLILYLSVIVCGPPGSGVFHHPWTGNSPSLKALDLEVCRHSLHILDIKYLDTYLPLVWIFPPRLLDLECPLLSHKWFQLSSCTMCQPLLLLFLGFVTCLEMLFLAKRLFKNIFSCLWELTHPFYLKLFVCSWSLFLCLVKLGPNFIVSQMYNWSYGTIYWIICYLLFFICLDFFLKWTIFKVFLEFITILLLLMCWYFGRELHGILPPYMIRDWTHICCIGRQSLYLPGPQESLCCLLILNAAFILQ